tara:strand:- start:4435 stop:5154 length:720 start_codon:yes stop_codon:yes gene_type:complete
MIKKFIKLLLSKNGWKIKKIIKSKNYSNEKPNLELINEVYNSTGIIHMGAHRGGEAPIYDWFQKKVIWIEANPKIFADLNQNIQEYYNQKAYNYLLSNVDNELKEFNISNNDGASSSIFKFGNLSIGNESQWKERNLKMVDVIKLKSISLDTFVVENKIDIELYNHWVLDLQGAELLVLNGAENSLKKCKSIFIEVSQGEVYKDGAQWNEIKSFLHKKNFKNSWNIEGNHTSVLFKKIT